jgi:hypothetical protein
MIPSFPTNPRSTPLARLGQWLAESSSLRLGVLIGAAVTLAKLPLLFMTLGEQDQARLIMDAFVYLTDGPETFRPCGSSPSSV